jgi:hypothetical protein
MAPLSRMMARLANLIEPIVMIAAQDDQVCLLFGNAALSDCVWWERGGTGSF